MVRRVGSWKIAALLASACAVGESDADGSGVATYPPMTAPSMTTTSPADDGSGSSSTQAESEISSEGSTAAVGGSSESGGDPLTGSGGTSAPITDTGENLPPQPEDGMYSDCLGAAMCVGLNTCITILDTDDMPIDGFCTNNACTAPATDCEPSPGGTAVPFCMMVTLGGDPDTACALDCSGGKTCPGGMMCWELGRTSVCA